MLLKSKLAFSIQQRAKGLLEIHTSDSQSIVGLNLKARH